MDIAYTIWLYDPQAEYLLTNANATEYVEILDWRGPSEKPSEELLLQLWEDYINTGHPTKLTVEERLDYLDSEVAKLKAKIK